MADLIALHLGECLHSQWRVTLTAVIDQHIRVAAFADRLSHHLHRLSTHLWEFLHDRGIRLGSLLGGFLGQLQRREESQDCEYRREPVHPCVLFPEGRHCSPMAEFSGFVLELPKVRAEPHSTTPGLLPGCRTLGRNECRSRWSAQKRPTG